MPCTRTGIPLRSIPAGEGRVRSILFWQGIWQYSARTPPSGMPSESRSQAKPREARESSMDSPCYGPCCANTPKKPTSE